MSESWCFLAVWEPLSHFSKINKLLKVQVGFCHVLRLFKKKKSCTIAIVIMMLIKNELLKFVFVMVNTIATWVLGKGEISPFTGCF